MEDKMQDFMIFLKNLNFKYCIEYLKDSMKLTILDGSIIIMISVIYKSSMPSDMPKGYDSVISIFENKELVFSNIINFETFTNRFTEMKKQLPDNNK